MPLDSIILASTSPRRQEILKMLSIPFTVISPEYTEKVIFDMKPRELAEFHAIKKVESIARKKLDVHMPWILGADTLIAKSDSIYGKPLNRDDASRMLHSFSGKTHTVITAICLFDASINDISTRISINSVSFIPLDNQQIENYLDTGEWQGVAGGYRIQGLASCFIDKIEGSYSGIVGLPINDLYAILRTHGYKFIV